MNNIQPHYCFIVNQVNERCNAYKVVVSQTFRAENTQLEAIYSEQLHANHVSARVKSQDTCVRV